MIYHLCGWYFFHPDASHFLGRMGVYGVSIFFILSGLSMAIVYHHFIQSARDGFAFMVRRGFRILPLLWVAILGTLTISAETPAMPATTPLLLNLSGLFGFIPPFGYMAVGSWSIGCEMVFYALTPFLFLAYNYRIWLGNLITFITVLIGIYFSSVLLRSDQTLASQWETYINPLNNLFLYTSGIAIFYNLQNRVIPNKSVGVLIAFPLLIFIAYPLDGNQIETVTGIHRILFSFFSMLLVIGFYQFRMELPKIITYPLEKLGLVTYGVYILHPIIKVWVTKWFVIWGMSNAIFIAISVAILSITAALISYYTIEIHLMRWGKRLTSSK